MTEGVYASPTTNVSISDIHKAQLQISHMRWSYWIHHVLGTFQWWLVLGFTVLVFTVCLWTLKRNNNMLEVLLYGCFTLIVIMFVDVLGGDLQIWEYTSMVLPWGARLICVDLDLALIYMMAYQLFGNWKAFLICNVILAAIFAFVFEPISLHIGIYEVYGWRHIYSFPFYIAIPVFAKFCIRAVSRRAHAAETA